MMPFLGSLRLLVSIGSAVLLMVWGGSASARTQEAVSPQIAYTLTVVAAPRLRVTVEAETAPTERLAFAIPAWTPGYYQILNYESTIENAKATDGNGKMLKVEKPSERVWEIVAPQPTSRFKLTYEVIANDSGHGFFGSSLRGKVGYINGTSAFMYLSGHTDAPVTLETRLPAGWKVATGLTPQEKDQSLSAHRLFQAKNYDEMVDCPLQFGKFDAFSFKVNGVPFQCILVGEHQANVPKLTRTLTRVAQAGFRMFGKFPFSQYLFIFHCGGAGFLGGLEHRNSTVIHTSPNIGDGEGDELLPVTMHEFFHVWNVKRIRPDKLGPFDYTQAVRTPSVWFAEGVTDYYAGILLARSGMRSREWLLGDLAGRIGNVDSTPSRRRVTLEEAGSKAWEGASMGFDGLNYYLKGSAIGFYFDMRIRALTQGKRSLDDVMRDLDAQYGEKNIGYPEEALLQTLNRVAGADLTAEYNSYVRGYEEIPWEKTAAALGLILKREATGFLGVQFDDNGVGGRPKAQTVLKGFAAEKMGMRAGDVIQSLNSLKVTSISVRDAIMSLKPNAALKIAIERDGVGMELEGMADAQYRYGTLEFMPQAQITPLMLRLRASFFAVLPVAPARAGEAGK